MWDYIIIICHIFYPVKARLPGLLNFFFEGGKVGNEKGGRRERRESLRAAGRVRSSRFNVGG